MWFFLIVVNQARHYIFEHIFIANIEFWISIDIEQGETKPDVEQVVIRHQELLDDLFKCYINVYMDLYSYTNGACIEATMYVLVEDRREVEQKQQNERVQTVTRHTFRPSS